MSKVRITYQVNNQTKTETIEADSRCDVDHAIKRIKDNVIVAGQAFLLHATEVVKEGE